MIGNKTTRHLTIRFTASVLIGIFILTSVFSNSFYSTIGRAASSTMDFPGITGYTSKNNLPSGNRSVHDGEIIYGLGSDGAYHYYCFSTDQSSNKLPIRVSDDLVNWRSVGFAFYYRSSSDYNCPAWLTTKTTTRLGHTFAGDPGLPVGYTGRVENDGNLFWAPFVYDNTKVDGYYYLYYSVSAFGTRNSNIGVAKSKTLDTGWVDCSIVMKSRAGDPYGYNAIDPSVLRDKEGRLWMVYGSFFRGMALVELDPNDPTRTIKEGDHGELIASRDDYKNIRNIDGAYYSYGVEGPTIAYDEGTGYYYLSVTYDNLTYTYNTRIARSKNINGPYTDYSGNNMASVQKLDGSASYGTKILAPYAFSNSTGWVATGHCTIFQDKNGHQYVGSNNKLVENGTSWLGIRKLFYTEEGYAVLSPEWYAGEDYAASSDVSEANVYIRPTGGAASWEIIRFPVENLINHTQYNSSTYELKNDFNVINPAGNKTGNWSLSADNMTIDFGEYTAKGKLLKGWDWDNWCETVLFTGIADDGSAIWGKQVVKKDSSSLLVQLKFDNNLMDSSENKVGLHPDATYNTGNLTYEEGMDGMAIRVPKMGTGNALSSVIRLQDGIIKNGNNFTITMWFKPDSLKLTPSTFFTQGKNTWGNLRPYQGTSSQTIYNKPVFRISNDGTKYDNYIYKQQIINFYDLEADHAVPLNQWTMVTVTYQNGTSKIYANGVLESSSYEKYPSGVISPVNNGVNQTYYIGGNAWDGTFDGLIDNFEIYDTALSTRDVTELYRKQSSITVTKLDITMPAKTTYELGEKLDVSDMVVKATYSDGTVESIVDYGLSGFDSNMDGSKTITVSFKDKTVTFSVTVKPSPTPVPTHVPTQAPIHVPTQAPTQAPAETVAPNPTTIPTPKPTLKPVMKKVLTVSGKSVVKRKKYLTLKASVKNMTGKITWSLDKRSKKLAKINTIKGKIVKLTSFNKKGTITVTIKCEKKTVTKKIKIQ